MNQNEHAIKKRLIACYGSNQIKSKQIKTYLI